MAVHSFHPALERRLRNALQGEVLFDPFSRGRYATDASFYQVMPLGVAAVRGETDLAAALAIAREEGVTVLARGGGTSQCGQTVNESLVLDTSKHFDRILELDVAGRRCTVEPGIVLDELNRALKPHGLWFPVDVSTSSRATIGGMAGNNSCGTRSIRYGMMRDNVIAIDALTADGRALRFAEAPRETILRNEPGVDGGLFRDLLALGAENADEIKARFPQVIRRVGGYNVDALVPNGPTNNLSHVLVGSEGTLALSTRIELKLSPLLPPKLVGACHFARFYDAMDAARHLVTLGPTAVELVDRTMIELARDIPMFRPTVERFVTGEPEAVLLVEFAEEEPGENRRRLARLGEMMGDLGYGFDREGRHWGGVVEIESPALQAAITDVRQSGLNIMMSMKDARKPVSFVEDCAVPLEHLADYTERLTAIFEKHGTRGTWYAHASVGCLHVRPVLNLKLDKDVKAMRAIAEEAFQAVRDYKGSHSGEHGDGIVRSEFHEMMFGRRMVEIFGAVKDRFDPAGVLNPGKIVRAPRMDDRSLFRYGPGYQPAGMMPVLDWSDWSGPAAGLQGAVEMCNNNGACRKLEGAVMCPSYRVTRNERDVTRGRANSLRLALSGQLGPDAFASDAMMETLKLCVSCKGCRRECPTGVDMAKMKIEVLAARAAERGIGLRERLVAWLPRYAPAASRLRLLMNLRDRIPGLPHASERIAGFAARRPLPVWRADRFDRIGESLGPESGREVVLLPDTFNVWFEPENLRAALGVLQAGGYRVHVAGPASGRPLCCGRTFLSAGLVEEARAEARRLVAAVLPFARRGVPVVGLEPSCILSLRDELGSMLPGPDARTLGAHALLFEEFLAREAEEGRLDLALAPLPASAYLHGHCHQKAFGTMAAVETALRLVPDLQVKTIASSCCGMAGAFGYQAETYEISMAMAELGLLPAVRKAEPDALIVADGTSCRYQIEHGAGRPAVHVARVLERSLLAAAAGRA
ncbi:FAD-binding and (Fe-S)-binding domain-containing protein [Propylenella binzhouense]|uniref:D-2-hydroxyglutarate dehydrogenase n=1 Tax=Propylenella binzhouense TaxID=2555902 RepID=A0A964T3S3_9HYPH|nr:FAD-binding and (Fe-S)-binding domain-containing protein [Propylenella binzhouense]MYZ47933.1 FAD-binding oxidoreductase [Propylenella binzhouense]